MGIFTARRAMWAFLLMFIALSWGCNDQTSVSIPPAEEDDAGWLEDIQEGCDDDLAECNDGCADLQTDPRHCGACGESCLAGEVCSDGQCAVTCPGTQEVCDGGCFDLELATNHCGECGNSCDAGAVCSEGVCSFSCSGDLFDCDGNCRDRQSDRNHCGACFNACDDGEVCSSGECAVNCGGGLSECNGVCRDVETDRNHCGSCNTSCGAGEVCVEGSCETSCSDGLDECGGTCRDLQQDTNHCGSCGNECLPGRTCLAGGCYSLDEYPAAYEGLTLWLRADDGLVTSGSDVLRWTDNSGLGHDAIQPSSANRPSLRTNALGSHRAARFDGSSYLVIEDLAEFDFDDEFTVITVVEPQNNGSGSNRGILDTGADGWAVVQAYDQEGVDANAIGLFKSGVGWDSHTERGLRLDTASALVLRKDGDQRSIRLEGEDSYVDTSSQEFVLGDALYIGSRYGGNTGQFQGDIVEVLLYDRALDDREMEKLETYLSERYGVYMPQAPWIAAEEKAMRVAVHHDRLARHQRNDANTNRLMLWLDGHSADPDFQQSPPTVERWSDRAPGGYHATESTLSRQPLWVQATYPRIAFDGVNNQMTTAGVPVGAQNGSAFSFAVWVKATENARIIGKTGSAFADGVTDANVYLRTTGGAVGWQLEYNNSNQEDFLGGTTDISDEWHLVVGIRDNWDFYIYVDGELDGHHEQSDYYSDPAIHSYNRALNPGKGIDLAHYRNSTVSEVEFGEVAIYDFALTPEEIEELYASWSAKFAD